MNEEIKCPWCDSIQFDCYEELEDSRDILLRKPYIAFCTSCENFFKIGIKTVKMKLIEVKEKIK